MRITRATKEGDSLRFHLSFRSNDVSYSKPDYWAGGKKVVSSRQRPVECHIISIVCAENGVIAIAAMDEMEAHNILIKRAH